MKKGYKDFKKSLENPRNSALFKLGLWLLFILIVIIYVKASNNVRVNNVINETEEKTPVLNYSKIKQLFLESDLNVEYQIGDYFITGTIIDNILNGTLEYNEELFKIKYDTSLYQIKKKEEIKEEELLLDICKEYLLPLNIFKIFDDSNESASKSDDEKIYSYQIDNVAYSVYLNEDKIEKIIILKDDLTYDLSFEYIK